MKIDNLFKIAQKKKASDVHLLAGCRPIVRIEGQLSELTGEPAVDGAMIESYVLPILTAEQKETLFKKRELDISYESREAGRLRINLHWEKNNLGLVARLIPAVIPNMEDLMMPEAIYELARQERGLILLTGPAGCGKSTSLAAIIELINNEQSRHIITLEDPIEFIFTPKKSIIRQRQLGTDITSFQEGLRHVLRQDPNVIMVGEMRDLETIETTITLAETGHLVLATLHTYNAAQTIDRIVDVFPPYQQNQIRLQLSTTLLGVITQLLVPGVNGGQVATREILINNPAVANLIRENKISQIKTVIQTSFDQNMITMDQDLKVLYQKGLITKEVAQSHMVYPKLLK